MWYLLSFEIFLALAAHVNQESISLKKIIRAEQLLKSEIDTSEELKKSRDNFQPLVICLAKLAPDKY